MYRGRLRGCESSANVTPHQAQQLQEEFFRMPALGEEKMAEGSQGGVDGMQEPELPDFLRGKTRLKFPFPPVQRH